MMTSFQQQRLMMNTTANAPLPPQIPAAPPLLPPPPPILPPPVLPSALSSNFLPPPMLPPGLPMGIPPPPMPPLPMDSTPTAHLPADPDPLMDEELEPQPEQYTMDSEPPVPGTEEPDIQIDPTNVPE